MAVMADPKHVANVKDGDAAWNEWRENNPATVPDLSGADLGRVNLSGLNLSRAELLRIKLFGADLRGADLVGADLPGADLRGANDAFNVEFDNLSSARVLCFPG